MSRVANGITIIEVPFFLMMATGIMMLTIGWYNYRANRINSLKMFIISLALFWFGCALFALGAHWYFSIDEPKKHQLQSLPQNIFYKSVLCNDSITTNYFLTCELSRKPLQITTRNNATKLSEAPKGRASLLRSCAT